MAALLGVLAAAFAFWFVIFSPWTNQHISFWPTMSCCCVMLATAALALQRKNLSAIFNIDLTKMRLLNKIHSNQMIRPKMSIVTIFFIGTASAVVLYGIFGVGHLVSSLILPFAQSQVSDLYVNREQGDLFVIAILLLFVIAPAEEIFWRGLVQDRFQKRFGVIAGMVLASVIYAAVHIWSFNFMLIAAAFVCGIFWGAMYACFGSLWPCIISHALWDVMIFVWLPIK